MTAATASALTSTGPRRARAGAVIAGGLPGRKMADVLSLLSTGSRELRNTHEAVPLVTVVVIVEVLDKSQATGEDG